MRPYCTCERFVIDLSSSQLSDLLKCNVGLLEVPFVVHCVAQMRVKVGEHIRIVVAEEHPPRLAAACRRDRGSTRASQESDQSEALKASWALFIQSGLRLCNPRLSAG